MRAAAAVARSEAAAAELVEVRERERERVSALAVQLAAARETARAAASEQRLLLHPFTTPSYYAPLLHALTTPHPYVQARAASEQLALRGAEAVAAAAAALDEVPRLGWGEG